jgi:hypothetical protein
VASPIENGREAYWNVENKLNALTEFLFERRERDPRKHVVLISTIFVAQGRVNNAGNIKTKVLVH